MKTRYKASIIVATSAIIYILFHGGISNICMPLINDGETCYMFWLSDTSIHITTNVWNEGNGTWYGTTDLSKPTIYDNLKDNSGFVFWHMVFPTFVILLIYQRDRMKK